MQRADCAFETGKKMIYTWRNKWGYGLKYRRGHVVIGLTGMAWLCIKEHRADDYNCPLTGRHSPEYWEEIPDGFIFNGEEQ